MLTAVPILDQFQLCWLPCLCLGGVLDQLQNVIEDAAGWVCLHGKGNAALCPLNLSGKVILKPKIILKPHLSLDPLIFSQSDSERMCQTTGHAPEMLRRCLNHLPTSSHTQGSPEQVVSLPMIRSLEDQTETY